MPLCIKYLLQSFLFCGRVGIGRKHQFRSRCVMEKSKAKSKEQDVDVVNLEVKKKGKRKRASEEDGGDPEPSEDNAVARKKKRP